MSTAYTYDPSSNLAMATYPNGLQSTFSYDPLNRLTAMSSPVSSYTYQLSPTGKRTVATEGTGRTLNWTYDGIYRLTNEAIASDPDQVNGSVSYSLDPVGNRLSETSSLNGINSGSFGYNADDEVSTGTYDNNGNTLTTGGKSFTYDAENHLTGMSVSGTTVSIVYDAFGNRVAKTVNGVTIKYLVEDDVNPTSYPQVGDELTGSTVTRTYTYGLQRINQAQIVDSTWTPSFYGYDGAGSVRQLTNSAGVVTDTCEYDAFDNEVNHTGTTPNNYLYSGEQYDPDLGLYYLRARYMNPLTGRFLSRDPGDGDVTEPATLHKYLYANGDPVNGADPTGWDDAETIQLYTRVSVSAPVIEGLEAAKAAISCALIWQGTKTFSEVVAGPFGTVEQFSPCIVIGRKPSAPPFPLPLPFPIPGTPPAPWPPRCPGLKAAKDAACELADSLGGCSPDMSLSKLQSTYAAWVACGVARAQYHKVCWNEGNEGHQNAEHKFG
jgi:RHS repeat-associated protein